MISVLGYPPQSPRYPRAPSALSGDIRYEWWPGGTRWAVRLWRRHFRYPHSCLPRVYWSDRIGRTTLVHAKCFHWGIVISRPQYRRVRKAQRAIWVRRVLLHELLHWSGRYRHDRYFRAAAKYLGTW